MASFEDLLGCSDQVKSRSVQSSIYSAVESGLAITAPLLRHRPSPLLSCSLDLGLGWNEKRLQQTLHRNGLDSEA